MSNQQTEEVEGKRIDAFILYNEREKVVDQIVEMLESNGISTHFWRRDVQYGEPILELEEQRFIEAEIILTFLGDFGWGETQLRYAEQAPRFGKRIIPVLIGNPEDSELDKANSIFRELRYIDLREPDEQSFKQLLDQLSNSPKQSAVHIEPNVDGFPNRQTRPDGFDDLVSDLISGDEKKRLEVLWQIRDTNIDRTTFAARLRREIQERFGPESEKNYQSARRSPNETPSIRSWMLSALIWSDPEHPDSRELLLRHINQLYEPNNFVRYWVLAGLYHRQVSFLNDALGVASKDSKAEVKALAQAIQSPNSNKIIEGFRKDLQSAKEERVWKVLRVLRMFPMPALVNDVCEVLVRSEIDSNTAYDAFYALSNRELAVEAAKILQEKPGISRVLEYLIVAVSPSNEYAIENFTVLLAAFESSELNQALSEAANNPQNREIVSRFRFYLRNDPENKPLNEIYAASYDSDTSDKESVVKRGDLLGIEKDVQTLCAVMISKTVTPPLAIGLFGDWGTGKSYFIQSMKVAVEKFTENPGTRFCSNVVQIEFNAWHYSDTNLLASMVSYILTELADFVAPQKTDEEKQAALLSELDSAKAIVKEAEVQKTNAQNLITNQQKELQELQTKRQNMEVKLSDLRMSDLTTILSTNETLKNKLTQSFHDVGIPAAFQGLSDLKQAVVEAHTIRSRATAIFLSLRKENSWGVRISIFLIILAIPAIFYLATKYLSLDNLVATVAALVAQIVGIIGIATKVIGSAVNAAKVSLDKIEAAKNEVDKLIAAKRANPTNEEINLQNNIVFLRAREEEASARVTAAAARVVELEERIRVIKEGRSLARFLVERTTSEDYRKHLGIISTIRQDFDNLRERLDEASQNKDVGFKKVDRIILYIDDLDRCDSDKVMEVLRAVHLLQAYNLFVVVVGVDPRWLLHSLETTHSAFQNSETKTQPNADVWRTTPQNYLEKIFQIPFNLKPMSSPGYGKLIDGLFATPAVKKTGESSQIDKPEAGSTPPNPLLTPEVKVESSETVNASVSADRESEINQSDKDKTTNEAQAAATVNPSAEAKTDGATIETTTKSDGATVATTAKPAFVVYEEALNVKEWESNFAKNLFTLIPTPRAAKRFTNIYRLLKAGVPRRDIPRFEGAQNVPGEFRIPMFLLAMLIGGATECTVLFPELQEISARKGKFEEALKILENPLSDKTAADPTIVENASSVVEVSPKRTSDKTVDLAFIENSQAFVSKVRRIFETQSIPHLPEVYAEWIPRVARFSFDVGRVVKAAPDESAKSSV